MKKRKIFMATILAGILFVCGCQTQNQKEAATEVFETAESQQTSMVDGTLSENTLEEEKADVGELEQEIIVEGNNGTIRIGTTGVPYTELLTQAKIQLAKKGWDLQIETYSDYEKMNQDVLNGTLDAHLFAHQTYVDSYNDVMGTTLTSVAKICYEKYGIYSKLYEDLINVKDGVSMGIPEAETEQAKALQFLQDAGYITLKENVGLTANLDDVTDNPKNIQFVEYNSQTVEELLKNTDYFIIGANSAILAGFEPHKEVLLEETTSFSSASIMATLLVTTPENVENEKLLILIDEFKTETIQKYAKETYKEALGLFFE